MRAATVGAAQRLRRRGVAASIVATLLAHAALLAALAGARPPARPLQAGASPAVTVRLWLAAHAAAPSRAPAPLRPSPSRVDHRTAAAAPAPVLAAAAPAPAELLPATAAAALATELPEAAPTAPEAISGAVFALPTIGLGGDSGTAGWRAAAAAPPQAVRAAAAPQPEYGQREHARAHLVRELLELLAALAPPPEPGAGRCEPDDGVPAPVLRCDSATLQRVFADGGEALAALLASYRSLDPRVRTAALAWHEGQYRLELR